VKRVGLEWEGIHSFGWESRGFPSEAKEKGDNDAIHNPEPSSGEKTVAAGAPTTDAMAVPATFSAEDYLPDRERAYSPYLVLHVLTPAEHFKWLTEQMSLWAGAAQEVYDKELQLHQTNRELRNLPPEALDDSGWVFFAQPPKRYISRITPPCFIGPGLVLTPE